MNTDISPPQNQGKPADSAQNANELDDLAAVEIWGRVIHGFEATSRVLNQRLAEDFDLNPAEAETLLTLKLQDKNRAPMKVLAQAAAFSTGGFTKIADRLTQRGFVERSACESDRRVTYLALTEEGLKLTEELTRQVAKTNREIFVTVLGLERAKMVAAAMTDLYRANNDR